MVIHSLETPSWSAFLCRCKNSLFCDRHNPLMSNNMSSRRVFLLMQHPRCHPAINRDAKKDAYSHAWGSWLQDTRSHPEDVSPPPSFFRTSRKTTPRQGVTEVPPTSGTQAVLPKFLLVHAFNPKRGKSEAGAGPSAGFSGAGVGRSSAYNGPSVSLCFYSQIGSAGLKEKWRRPERQRRSPRCTRGTRTRGGCGTHTLSQRQLAQPAWRITRSMSEVGKLYQNPGKKKGEIPPNAERRLWF